MASSSALTRDPQPVAHPAGAPATSFPLGFRRVPSPAGWMALLASGAAAGLAVGVTAARRGARPGRVAAAIAAGALLGMALARFVDEMRWRRSAVCVELTEPDAVLDLLQAVRAQGVQADMIRAGDGGRGAGAGYALRYRARDDRRVRAVLASQQP